MCAVVCVSVSIELYYVCKGSPTHMLSLLPTIDFFLVNILRPSLVKYAHTESTGPKLGIRN